MKLSVLVLIAVALIAPVTTLGQQVELFDNFLTPEETAFFKARVTSNNSLSLPKALVERIKSTIGGDQSCLVNQQDDEIEIKVQARLIKENTQVHVDHYHDSGDPVQESAAFVFLDDNDGGFFRLGEQDVPAVAGRLVKFPGNIPHSSFIEKGSFRLLGPFDTKTFANVGPGASSFCVPNPCNPGFDCTDTSPGFECKSSFSPPNEGGAGQNGIPFPQGVALDDPFVPAGNVADISFAQLNERFNALLAFFGGN